MCVTCVTLRWYRLRRELGREHYNPVRRVRIRFYDSLYEYVYKHFGTRPVRVNATSHRRAWSPNETYSNVPRRASPDRLRIDRYT